MSNWHGRVCVSGWFGCVSEKARMGPHCRRRFGAFRLSRIQQTSLTWGFAETPLAIRIIVLALGPWTPPFRAPLGRFLPIQARQSAMGPHCGVFCRPLLPIPFVERFRWGLPIGFQPSASAKGSGQALARGAPAKNCCKGFYGVFRMILCDGWRSTSRNENLALASGAGHRFATKPRVCCRVNTHPVLNDGVSRSRPRRPAVSGVE